MQLLTVLQWEVYVEILNDFFCGLQWEVYVEMLNDFFCGLQRTKFLGLRFKMNET